jgi:3-hydroxyisobutyrate dehydrogenase-like beta-hydroxyacid dehydrogenase
MSLELCALLVTFYLLQCRDFVKAGAEQGQTPSDVILAADITFSCVADPQAAKDVMQLFP